MPRPDRVAARSCDDPAGRQLVSLRRRGRLREADVVAERVAQPAVDPVRALRRLLRKLDPATVELFVGLAAIVVAEEQVTTGDTLGDVVADLSRGLVVHRRLAGALEQDLARLVAGHAHHEPTPESRDPGRC